MGRSFAWLVVLGLLAAHPAQAADTVRIVVPYVPAGTADIMARLIAPELQGRIGVNVIVENREIGRAHV